jgi:hypothetical protein
MGKNSDVVGKIPPWKWDMVGKIPALSEKFQHGRKKVREGYKWVWAALRAPASF